MAIAFLRAQFISLHYEGAFHDLCAYIVRGTVPGLAGRADFRRIDAADLVHHEMLPMLDGGRGIFGAIGAFAVAVEQAEPPLIPRRAPRGPRVRQRFPQAALSLVFALPPDGEMSLDEAVALIHGIVDEVRDGFELPACGAIHDPARRAATATSRNRHAHIFIALREISGNGLSRHKVRDLVAHPRPAQVEGPWTTAIGEGIAWPDLAVRHINRAFLRSDLQTRVRPIAVRSAGHLKGKGGAILGFEQFGSTMHTGAADRLDCTYLMRMRRKTRIANEEALRGDPVALIHALARGRTAILHSDLESFAEAVVDDEDERRRLLTRIRADERVVELVDPVTGVAARLTSRARYLKSHALARIVLGLTDGAARITVARAPDRASTRIGFDAALAAVTGGFARSRIVLCGARGSHGDGIDVPKDLICQRIGKALEDAASWGNNTVIGVPVAGLVTDADLTDLIVTARERGARIVLGIDESALDGLSEHRVATWIAAVLAPRTTPADPADRSREAAARLKTGFIKEGVDLLRDHLSFGLGNRIATAIRVGDDPHSRAASRGALLWRGSRADGPSPVLVGEDGEAVTIGQDIIAISTLYARRGGTPRLRAGQTGTLAGIEADSRRIHLLVAGQRVTVSGTDLGGVRTWTKLQIREARHLPPAGRPIRISVSRPESALAALMLLAERARPDDRVAVSQELARDGAELAARIELSLPAAFAGEFDTRVARAASIELALDALLDGAAPLNSASEAGDRDLALAPPWIDGVVAPGSARAALLPLVERHRSSRDAGDVGVPPDPEPIPVPDTVKIKHPADGPAAGGDNLRMARAGTIDWSPVIRACLPPAALAIAARDPMVRQGLEHLDRRLDEVGEADLTSRSAPLQDLVQRLRGGRRTSDQPERDRGMKDAVDMPDALAAMDEEELAPIALYRLVQELRLAGLKVPIGFGRDDRPTALAKGWAETGAAERDGGRPAR